MTRLKLMVTSIAIASLAVLCGAVLFFFLHTPAHTITVINAGSVPVDTLTVSVCGKEYTFDAIPPEGSTSITFAITGDSGFLVHGKLENGQVIDGSFGYVTKNVSKQTVTILVQDDGTVVGRQ